MQKQTKNRVFSVELKSISNLKNLTLTSSDNETVLLEGSIRELVEATFTEGVILEVIGKSGTLRVDLEEEEIKKKQLQNKTEAK